MSAQVGIIAEKLGKESRQFGLLSVEDMVSLTNMVTFKNGCMIDATAVERWITTPEGCEQLLSLASQTIAPAAPSIIRKWGSFRQRSQLAMRIWLESVVSGEEDLPDPKAMPPETGASQNPATGG